MIKDNLHVNWKAVHQLKVQVKDWLSDHLAGLQNAENQDMTTKSLSFTQEDTIPINQWIQPQGLFKDMN
jgi:pyruvate/2-oxoglutarate dehydrogenase complex dihydrolipoamide dehydrogenase (E3) component